MSTSYPYLAIARQQNEDYGLVLWYADLMQDQHERVIRFTLVVNDDGSHEVTRNIWVQHACAELSATTKLLIKRHVTGEVKR